MIVTGMDASWLQLYIFFWSAHFAALLLTTVLLLYHLNLVIQGEWCCFMIFLNILARFYQFHKNLPGIPIMFDLI